MASSGIVESAPVAGLAAVAVAGKKLAPPSQNQLMLDARERIRVIMRAPSTERFKAIVGQSLDDDWYPYGVHFLTINDLERKRPANSTSEPKPSSSERNPQRSGATTAPIGTGRPPTTLGEVVFGTKAVAAPPLSPASATAVGTAAPGPGTDEASKPRYVRRIVVAYYLDYTKHQIIYGASHYKPPKKPVKGDATRKRVVDNGFRPAQNRRTAIERLICKPVTVDGPVLRPHNGESEVDFARRQEQARVKFAKLFDAITPIEDKKAEQQLRRDRHRDLERILRAAQFVHHARAPNTVPDLDDHTLYPVVFIRGSYSIGRKRTEQAVAALGYERAGPDPWSLRSIVSAAAAKQQ